MRLGLAKRPSKSHDEEPLAIKKGKDIIVYRMTIGCY